MNQPPDREHVSDEKYQRLMHALENLEVTEDTAEHLKEILECLIELKIDHGD